MPGARETLLAAVVDDVARHGLGDRSLREIAASVGSSHRMLNYHFGSRGGLVAAIVESVESSQRTLLAQLATDAVDADDLIRRLWHAVSAPELRTFVRLFFECVALDQGVDWTTPWLHSAADVIESIGGDLDPVEVRLGIAVTRGLLIDVVATGDLDAATASLDRFIEWRRHQPRTLPAELETKGTGTAAHRQRRPRAD